MVLFFFKQKTAYEMRISDWSSDVCSSDLADEYLQHAPGLDWEVLLAGVTQAGSHRVVLDALVYESRWTRDGQLRDVEELKCLGLQSHGCKKIGRASCRERVSQYV